MLRIIVTWQIGSRMQGRVIRTGTLSMSHCIIVLPLSSAAVTPRRHRRYLPLARRNRPEALRTTTNALSPRRIACHSILGGAAPQESMSACTVATPWAGPASAFWSVARRYRP
jgi:hypothetical protein